jgi:alkylated DNA nucleotide flippase Atl1
MSRPYIDNLVGNTITRTFDQSIDPIELMWHRDLKDRTVTATHNTDWKVQLDNELPTVIKDSIFIPKLAWHRVIKGAGALTVKITEHETAN